MFKIGDKIIRTSECSHGFVKIGDIGVILHVFDADPVVKVQYSGKTGILLQNIDNIEKIEMPNITVKLSHNSVDSLNSFLSLLDETTDIVCEILEDKRL